MSAVNTVSSRKLWTLTKILDDDNIWRTPDQDYTKERDTAALGIWL